MVNKGRLYLIRRIYSIGKNNKGQFLSGQFD
jgi:hypothetical protein